MSDVMCKERGLTVKVSPLGRECPSYFEGGFEGVPEPVPTSGSQWSRHTVEEHPIHGHLYANVSVPNSCYIDDIYCCN